MLEQVKKSQAQYQLHTQIEATQRNKEAVDRAAAAQNRAKVQIKEAHELVEQAQKNAEAQKTQAELGQGFKKS